MNIKIVVPTAQEKGFLRRQQKALAFAEAMRSGEPSPAMIDAMTDFIVGFVTEPVDKVDAKDAILDLSQEDFEAVIASITGSNPVPKASAPASEDGISPA